MIEIIPIAVAQYVTIFFFVVMVLPAVIIFCGYLMVPSRFMRKIVCRLRLSEVSRQ